MTVALIGAGGVIIVALITVTGSFLQSRDRRAGMKHDAELLQLLPEDHEARDDLSRWLGREIRHHIERGENRATASAIFRAHLVSYGFMAVTVGLLVTRKEADLSDRTKVLLLTFAIIGTVLSVLALAWAYYSWIVVALRLHRASGARWSWRDLFTPQLAIESRFVSRAADASGPRARGRDDPYEEPSR